MFGKSKLVGEVWQMDRLSHRGNNYKYNLIWQIMDDSLNFVAVKHSRYTVLYK